MKRLCLIFFLVNLLSSTTNAFTHKDIISLFGLEPDEEIDTCENPCGENEVYVKNKRCSESCADGWQIALSSLDEAEKPSETDCERKKGCQCAQGYFRDKSGKCVDIYECPRPKCPKNQKWSDGEAHCSATCYDLKGRICLPIVIPGCRCKKGFVRLLEGKGCMPASKCTKEIAEAQFVSDLEELDIAGYLPEELDFLGKVKDLPYLNPPDDVEPVKSADKSSC
ncbi:hypothetical protein AB6A40_002230 [Gnathostoma spinigerum]|uniref:TIL domain-containing protein n=1 Tax=Gnathostoma spinigerum TaxID=75299 RepID=A0ABD6EDR2_9BILA